MSSVWYIDFETYSQVDLRVSGAFRYAEDPTTEALILAYSDGRGEVCGVNLTLPDAFVKLRPLFNAVQEGAALCAHNAQFERLIWTKVCRFPVTPKPHQWDCTAARARMIAIPGALDKAAKALGLNVTKDPRGEELIQLFSKPQRKGGRVLPSERPEEFAEFIRYCEQDVLVELMMDRILPPLSSVEKRAFLLDYEINSRGLPVNLDLVKKADVFVAEYSEQLAKKAVAIAGCRPSQREKTLDFLARQGFPLPNLQAGTVLELAEDPRLPPPLRELIDYRIELTRAGTKKLKAIQAGVSEDGRIRGSFLFSAASTRRWSSVGVQVHNLQKPEGEAHPDLVLAALENDPWDLLKLFRQPLSVLAQSIRAFFESPQFFRVADYSSVEPRGLSWLAGEEWLLEAYRKKQDAYKIAASRVYGVPPENVNEDQRFMGKQLILGCGYGMGPPRFVETVRKFGRELPLDAAKEAVMGFRQSAPKIVQFWRGLEQSCIRAVRDWKTVQLGRLTFRPQTLSNGFRVLFVDLPSGTIAYPKPGLGQEEWNGTLRDTFTFWTPLGAHWVQTDTFGGSLAENVTQALTRDILRDGMLAANDSGFQVIGHVHDEVIDEGVDNPQDLRDLEHLLCNSSPWAEGFPIATAGYISKRYRK